MFFQSPLNIPFKFSTVRSQDHLITWCQPGKVCASHAAGDIGAGCLRWSYLASWRTPPAFTIGLSSHASATQMKG